MDFSKPYATDNDRRKANRRLFHQAYLEPLDIDLLQRRPTDDSVLGRPELVPDDLHDPRIRRKLTVRIGEDVVLQRLVPRFETRYFAMMREMAVGRALFDETQASSVPKNTSRPAPIVAAAADAASVGDRRSEEDREGTADNDGAVQHSEQSRYHLGVWYGRHSTYATPTSDTRRLRSASATVDQHDATMQIFRFAVWLRHFVQQFVQPLVDERGVVAANFSTSLSRRNEDYQWLVNEVPMAAELCHPLYSSSSPFRGFTGEPHIDRNDAQPTILLNFGYSRLQLTEYAVEVDLFPCGHRSFRCSASVACDGRPS